MDIFKLLDSKTREKILRLFFSDPEKKYYLRELEKILSVSVGNIRRELISLEKISLFKKEKVANLVYYSLNQNSPFFEGIEVILQASASVDSKKVKKELKTKSAKENFVAIKKDDLDSLIYRIGELENIVKGISKSIPTLSIDDYVAKKGSEEKDKVMVRRIK